MLREIAYAKINLALHVQRRRPDGYHDIETVFAFCEDGDVVAGQPANRLSLTIDGPFEAGLSTTDNLVIRAAESLALGRGADIRLTKNLPVASGIGGGSADAAATLRLLSRLWGVDADLTGIAAGLGADVPACIASTTARGDGRGDDLVAINAQVSGIPVLLVNPGVAVSTAAVFKNWDGVDRGPLSDWREGRNDLQAAACALAPEINGLLHFLQTLDGVDVARMSGSGATCFALLQDADARGKAAEQVRRSFPTYWLMESSLR